jgi:hypothetical protein
MTGWRRVDGLRMLKVYRVCGDVEGDVAVSVERDVGVGAAVCLRAHRAVVTVPSASV